MNFDLKKDLLPVGSVVSLRFRTGKYMIIGFMTVEGNSKKIYEYSAVEYPFGVINLDKVTMFNRDLIKNVYYLGYSSDLDLEFKKSIADAIKNNKFKNLEDI